MTTQEIIVECLEQHSISYTIVDCYTIQLRGAQYTYVTAVTATAVPVTAYLVWTIGDLVFEVTQLTSFDDPVSVIGRFEMSDPVALGNFIQLCRQYECK